MEQNPVISATPTAVAVICYCWEPEAIDLAAPTAEAETFEVPIIGWEITPRERTYDYLWAKPILPIAIDLHWGHYVAVKLPDGQLLDPYHDAPYVNLEAFIRASKEHFIRYCILEERAKRQA